MLIIVCSFISYRLPRCTSLCPQSCPQNTNAKTQNFRFPPASPTPLSPPTPRPAPPQILDDGRVSDSQGRVVSFKHTLIIMTSNLGAAEVYRSLQGGASASLEAVKEVVMGKVSGWVHSFGFRV